MGARTEMRALYTWICSSASKQMQKLKLKSSTSQRLYIAPDGGVNFCCPAAAKLFGRTFWLDVSEYLEYAKTLKVYGT